MKTSLRNGLAGLGVLAGWYLISACTTNASSQQCAASGDCDALGLVGYECTLDGLCQLPQRVTPAPGEDGGGLSACNTDDECVAENGNRPAICPQPGVGKCLPIANEYCKVDGDYKNKGAIFLGDFRSNNSPNSVVSFFSINGTAQWDLAWGQINTALPGGGVPGPNGGARRPIVRIICEDRGDDAITASIAAHLVNDIHTPVVLGLRGQATYAVQQEAGKHPEYAPLIWAQQAVTNMRSSLAGTGDTANIFQTQPGYDELAPGYSKLISDAEVIVRAEPGFTGEVRVAVLVNSDPQIRGAADAIVEALVVNTKPASAQPETVKRFDYDQTDPSAAVAQVALLKPHVIVTVASVEAARFIIPQLEGVWSGAWKPRYVALGLQANVSLLDAVGINDELRRRFVGLFPSAGVKDLTRFGKYRTEYAAAFPTYPLPVTANGYDPAYALAYTIAVASAKSTQPATSPPTVVELRQALAWVTNQATSSTFFAGPGDLNAGIAAALTAPIRLRGLSLSFNLDASTGSSLDAFPVWCIGKAGAGYAINFATGQSYDATTKQVSGTFSCP